MIPLAVGRSMRRAVSQSGVADSVCVCMCVLQKCQEEGQCVREPLATTTASCAILESPRRNKQIHNLSEKVSCRHLHQLTVKKEDATDVYLCVQV